MMRHVLIGIVLVGLLPSPAWARQSDAWDVTIAPLYLWASELDGQVSVRQATVPVFMDFGTAVEQLAGIFTFHGEAKRGRWGVIGDVAFVRLSTGIDVTIPGLLPQAPDRTAAADLELGNTIVEGAVSYQLAPERGLAIFGGVRTYTMAPTIDISTSATQVTPVDVSQTAANAIVGVTFRPRLSNRFSLYTRADIGGGSGLTWSGDAGLQVRLGRRASLLLGYRALGVNVGTVSMTSPVAADDRAIAYDMTHYGPALAFNLHFGQ